MPFPYSKVRNEHIEHDNDDTESPYFHDEPRRSKFWTRLLGSVGALKWPVTFLLLFAILLCELSVMRRHPSLLAIGAELNGLVPRFSQEYKKFRDDGLYVSDHKTMDSINATKHNWEALMPVGGGFIDVQDYASYDLPPPQHYKESPGKEVFTIAVFHELHCLMHMTSYMDKLILQIRNKDWEIDEHALEHNDHCINYLHNALLCCGDTTLEGQSQVDKLGTDGTGAVHVCRNYGEISEWAIARRITDGKESL
ncbi:hypothetical protein DE146DRAFT_730086 [Phaeosphaeria sp. MPI-PUGE-AT-0046c]|nr:hypothetical protein DE146DRAFT_730086 [Phaeosphaeria sp. MPI-PUGE-AT-0046c]